VTRDTKWTIYGTTYRLDSAADFGRKSVWPLQDTIPAPSRRDCWKSLKPKNSQFPIGYFGYANWILPQRKDLIPTHFMGL
jgi:hypothetical protein